MHTNTVVPIPGLNSVAEVDNAVKAVKERRELDVKEKAEIQGANDQLRAALPNHYEWLRNWESV